MKYLWNFLCCNSSRSGTNKKQHLGRGNFTIFLRNTTLYVQFHLMTVLSTRGSSVVLICTSVLEPEKWGFVSYVRCCNFAIHVYMKWKVRNMYNSFHVTNPKLVYLLPLLWLWYVILKLIFLRTSWCLLSWTKFEVVMLNINRMKYIMFINDLGNRDYGHRDPLRWPRDTPLSTKVGTNFADKRRLLGRV
jgi:hypothetical protein